MARKKRQLQLINVLYFRQRRDQDDKILIIYKDEDTGEKEYSIVEDPKITYYYSKDEYANDRKDPYIEKEKVNARTVNSRDLLKDIADTIGEKGKTFFKECLATKKYYFLNQLHTKSSNIYSSDTDIADLYIGKFYDKHPPEKRENKLHKGYFDIEVDVSDYHEGFPDEKEAPCPINIVTYYDAKLMESYSFALRDPSNPQIKALESNIGNFKKELNKRFKEEYNMDIKFFINFYDEEIELIKQFFKTVHRIKPDFCGAWNMRFDALTLMNRTEKLGYDTERIMTANDIDLKMVYYKEDTYNQDPAERNDYFYLSGYTNWIDQMLTYAKIRATFGKKDSYALNAIAEDELGDSKDVFPPGVNIKNLPVKDYKRFVHYNIKDVILLDRIEDKIKDIDLIYKVSQKTRTRVTKALTKTTCLKNLARKFFWDQGYVIGNNYNRTYGSGRKPTTRFRGAFVANPNLMEKTGMTINGSRSNKIFENIIDMDLSSLYPSIIMAFNIDFTTQYGKLIFREDEKENEKICSKFIDTLVSKDTMALANQWFNLPLAEDLINEFERSYIVNES